jgi:prevent-host-death family protein
MAILSMMADMDKKRLINHRGQSVPVYTATEAKNAFGTVLEDAARYGAVGISKRDKPRFVVLSIEEYTALQPPTLKELEAEFDRRVAAMQTPTR